MRNFAVAATMFATPLLAQEPPAQHSAPPGPVPLFASHEPLRFTLTADYGTIFKERDAESTYHPARLTIAGPDGTPTTIDVQLRTRGHFRLQPRICGFPPLRVDFPKDSVVGTVFEDQNRIDLATHCQDRRDQYEQITLMEYLIYRTFNLFTDKSFKVRLARITYVDAAGKRDTLTRHAFFVEDKPALAARIGGKVFDMQEVHDENTERDQTTLVTVFQYFIGNTDWSVWALHNILLVELPPEPFPTAIPFDFDWSGVANAPYAKPDYRLKIRTVRERLYRGYCRPVEELEPVFALFNQKKDEIYALYQTQEGLTEETRRKALEYFDEFYKTINDPKAVEREFIRSCRPL